MDALSKWELQPCNFARDEPHWQALCNASASRRYMYKLSSRHLNQLPTIWHSLAYTYMCK